MPKALLGTAILAHLCVGASFLLNAASYRSGHSVLPDFGDGDNRGLFLHLGMPGKRSVQAWFGWRRAKDAYYSTSHSAPGLKFIEVPCHLAAQAKCIVRSKVLHHSRDAMVGATTHFARQASLGAARVGAISRETLKQDLRIHTAANSAKHTTLLSGRPAWADIAEQSDGDFDVLSTASGPSSALVWPSTATSSPTVSGTWLTVRAPCHPTVEWDSPAALRGPTAATQTDCAGTCDVSTQTCDVEQNQQPPPYDELQSYQYGAEAFLRLPPFCQPLSYEHADENQHLPPESDLQGDQHVSGTLQHLPPFNQVQSYQHVTKDQHLPPYSELQIERFSPSGGCPWGDFARFPEMRISQLTDWVSELSDVVGILQAQSSAQARAHDLTVRELRGLAGSLSGAVRSRVQDEFVNLSADLSRLVQSSLDAVLERVHGVVLNACWKLSGNFGPRIAKLEGHFQPDVFAQVLGSLSDPALVPALCEVFLDADLDLATRAPPCPCSTSTSVSHWPSSTSDVAAPCRPSSCSAADPAAGRCAD